MEQRTAAIRIQRVFRDWMAHEHSFCRSARDIRTWYRHSQSKTYGPKYTKYINEVNSMFYDCF
jgi:hypothetical protein